MHTENNHYSKNQAVKSLASDSPFLYFVSICLLTIIILLLLFRRRDGDRKVGRLLLVYFLSFFYLIAVSYVFVYGPWYNYIHLLRTGHFSSLFMPVAGYFYLVQCLYPRKWQVKDLLHLLPVAFYLADLFPFFLLSAQEKAAIFMEMDALEYRMGLSQGYLMPKFGHLVVRTVIMAGYWVAQLLVIIRAVRESFHPLRLQSPHTWRWLFIFQISQALIFLIPLVGALLGNSVFEVVISAVAGTGVMAIQSFYLLLHPEILYPVTFRREPVATPGMINQPVVLVTEVAPIPESGLTSPLEMFTNQKENKLSEADIKKIESIVTMLMKNSKPYEKPGYTLNNFSEDTGISAYKLSAFINTKYQINFNEYLNRFRIGQVIEHLAAGADTRKTLEAIALESGFKSRGTFIRAFKKEHSMTPSEFIDQKRRPKE